MLCYMDIPDVEAKHVAYKPEHAIDDNTFAYITAWGGKEGIVELTIFSFVI